MEILTGEQMRRVDRRAIEGLGVAGLDLMEAAGRGVAEAMARDLAKDCAAGILVLCGKGNNGGDGLVAARHLLRLGYRAQVLLLAAGRDLRGDALANLVAARGAGIEVHEVPDPSAWSRWRPALERPGLAVDALLGTGVAGAVHGLLGQVIEDLGASARTIVSIDLPSGLDADRGTIPGPAVRARRTYTLCRPKVALVLEPAALLAGEWTVLDIGIPDAAVETEAADLEFVDATAVRGVLAPRPRSSHKGTFGHLLVVAGSRGKPGAAVLAGRGALRAGVGLVTVATPASAQSSVAVQQAELMTAALPETADGSLSRGASRTVLELIEPRNALALGPGIGTESETRLAVRRIVERCPAPAVIDADALNALAYGGGPGPLRAPAGPALVLTPHPGEAARLLGWDSATVQADRLAAARRLAHDTGGVVALKGWRTVIARPDGRASFNATGNPGMATAGTGDVLTGIVGALLARGVAAADAARLGVFVHGDAGDRAARRLGEEGMTASDVLEDLPAALAALAARVA